MLLSVYMPCKHLAAVGIDLQSFTISRTQYGWHHMQLYINSWWIVLLGQCIGHVDVHFHPPHTTRNRVPALAILWLITQIQTKICENLSTSKMLSCVHPNLDSVHSTSQTRQPKNQNLKAYSNLRHYLHSMYTSVLSPVPKCIYRIQYGWNNSREVCHSFGIYNEKMGDPPVWPWLYTNGTHLQLSWAYGKAGNAWKWNGNWKQDINPFN